MKVAFAPFAAFTLSFAMLWIIRRVAISAIGVALVAAETVAILGAYMFFTLSLRTAQQSNTVVELATNMGFQNAQPLVTLVGFVGGIACIFTGFGLGIAARIFWKELTAASHVLAAASRVILRTPLWFWVIIPLSSTIAFVANAAFSVLGALSVMAEGAIADASIPS